MITSEAVRELRKALGESQQAFSNRLGLSLSSIAHYEGGHRSPEYVVAQRLFRLACEVGRQDLADFFITICGGEILTVGWAYSEDDRRKIQAMLKILHDPKFRYIRKPLLKSVHRRVAGRPLH